MSYNEELTEIKCKHLMDISQPPIFISYHLTSAMSIDKLK